jgi:hypothetical protein
MKRRQLKLGAGTLFVVSGFALACSVENNTVEGRALLNVATEAPGASMFAVLHAARRIEDRFEKVLEEARLLLPRTPLVRAPYANLPFRRRVFGGLWMNAALVHLPRGVWREAFATLLGFLEVGPVYFTCIRGSGDLAPVDDAVLGRIYRSDAHEEEVEALLASHGLRDVQVELRPDPVYDRKRPWVVALARQI